MSEEDIESGRGQREESQALLSGEEDEDAELLAGGGEDDEDDDEDFDFSDDDSELFGGVYEEDSDEEVDFDYEEADTWQREVAAVKDPSISEATLHLVPWAEVITEILFSSLAIAAYTIVLIVLDKSPLLLLAVFCVWTMLVVFAVEVAGSQGTSYLAVYGTAAVGPAVVLAVLHSSRFVAFVLMGLWIFALSAIWLLFAFMCSRRTVYRSAVYQACSGLVRVRLRSRKDVALLAKGIKFIHPSKLRANSDMFTNFLAKNAPSLGYKRTCIGSSMVVTDPEPRVPNVKLKLDGLEIDEGEFVLSHVEDTDPNDSGTALPVHCLETTLKRRGAIADKVISTWFADSPPPKDESKAKESEEQKSVREWFQQHQPDTFPLLATFKRINRWDSLYNHFAARALTCLAATVMLSLPMFRIVKTTVLMHSDMCKEPVPATLLLPDGSPLCGANGLEACAAVCANTVNFFEGVNAALNTSYVEFLLMFVLVPVVVFTLAVQWVSQQHEKLERQYFERLHLSKVATRELLESKNALESLMSMQKLWERFRRRFKAWNPLDLGDPDLVACGRMSQAEVSGNAVSYENEALMQTLKRVRMVLSSVTPSEEMPLTFGLRCDEPGEPDAEAGEDEDDVGEEERELVDTVASTMAEYSIVGNSDRNFKAVFVVKCQNVKTWLMWKKWLGIDEKKKGETAASAPAAGTTSGTYEKQLKYILDPKNVQAQDSGRGSHVDVTTQAIIGDQAIPRGFSLTHIYTFSRTDKSLFQIDIGGEKSSHGKGGDKDEQNKALQDLKKEVKTLEQVLKVDKAIKKLEEKPAKKEGADEDSDDEDDPLEGDEDMAICIRFCFSEQYYNQMESKELEALLDKKISGIKTKSVQQKVAKKRDDAARYFPDFVRIMLAPEIGPIQDEENLSDGSTTSGLTFLLAGSNPLQAVFHTAFELLSRFMVFFLCLCFVLLVPIWRCFVQGGSFFPAPYTVYLALNCFLCALAMWYFLNDFHTTSYRLELIAGCLTDFEQKTLDPSGKQGKKGGEKKDEGKKEEGGEAAPGAGGETPQPPPAENADEEAGGGKGKEGAGGPKTSPFDLVILESSSTKYNPLDKWWQDEWKAKQKNVENWHLSAGYMRVFVSSSRLTAQTILLAAAAILMFLLVFSLVQAMQGKGAVSVNAGDVKGFVSDQISSGGGGDRLRRLLDDPKERLALSPFMFALHAAHHSDGDMVAESLQVAAVDMNAVKADAAEEISLSALLENTKLPDYSEQLDRIGVETVGDLLSYVKESDLEKLGMPVVHIRKLFGAAREAQRQPKSLGMPPEVQQSRLLKEEDGEEEEDTGGHLAAAADALKQVNVSKVTKTQMLTVVLVLLLLYYSVPLIWYMAKVNDAFDRHSSLLVTTKEVHRMNMARREDNVLDAIEEGAEDAPSFPESKDGSKIPKDMSCKRYERLLDLAIQSASENKTRFPLKLFGFIINSAVLGGWIALALSPVLQEAQHMVPEAVMMGCTWMETSGILDQVQQAADAGTSLANEVVDSAGNSTRLSHASHVGSINAKKLFHDFVCTPLKDYMDQQSADAESSAEDQLNSLSGAGGSDEGGDEASAERRRLQAHRQAAALQEWWLSYPGHAHQQHFVIRRLLDVTHNWQL
mmetsp:Transcript_69530/g.166695  ORF Transcript_69530/g.166695 Transcript_69530/m.166695 type:complete len:1625 (-) Transcript_69530:81-4955(-)